MTPIIEALILRLALRLPADSKIRKDFDMYCHGNFGPQKFWDAIASESANYSNFNVPWREDRLYFHMRRIQRERTPMEKKANYPKNDYDELPF